MKFSKKVICLSYQLFFIISLCGQTVYSATYYVKASGGNGDGLSDATAWSYDKFNTTTTAPGSTIYFNRGDRFYGKLNLQSGVTYDAYGAGANPTISGFTTATAWTQLNGSIYYTTVDMPELNVVMIDDRLRAMGRYPKTGYLTYTSHSGNDVIADNTTLPFNPTGAEVVIRKIRQVTDRHIVTYYTGTAMYLSGTGAINTVFANNTTQEPRDRNGYFIQASLSTLTEFGEWYYDKSARRLYVYFGGESPANHSIRVSTVSFLSQPNNISNVILQNLDFEGANREIISSNNGNAITINNCNFRKSYGCIYADNGMSNLTVRGGSISDMLNSGIAVPYAGNSITVDQVTLRNIGTIPGAGGSGDDTQLGIRIVGDNATVANCSLENIGFHGIVLHGNNTLIEKNLINTFGLVKDDCGAIYEFHSGVTQSNKIVRNNIVLNGVGAAAGAPWYAPYGEAAAIYLDTYVSNVKAYDNVLAHGSWGGIMISGAGVGNEFSRNLVYDFGQCMLIHSFIGIQIRNLTLTDNQFIAKTSQQSPLYLQMYTGDNISQYGNFNRNIYARPVDDNATITINQEYDGGWGVRTFTLAGWQALTSLDANSTKSAVATDNENNLRFDYNASNSEQVINLGDQYTNVSNTIRTSTLRLPAYGGSVLVKAAPVVNPTGCSATGTILYERWDNVPGVFIYNIPQQTTPTFVGSLTSFEGPVDFADNYASRVRGYICAPQTGQYTFWLAGDDASELWLSTDDNPANKVRIAWVDGWTNSREWTKYASQKSVSITLQAGKKYYVEALQKEGTGGDNLAVQWQLPSGVTESPLPGRYLSPYIGGPGAGRIAAVEGEVHESSLNMHVYPNPFAAETTIEFSLPESAPATLRLYDTKGRIVKSLFDGSVEAHQPQQVKANVEQLPGGVYLLQLISGKQVLVKKAILSP